MFPKKTVNGDKSDENSAVRKNHSTIYHFVQERQQVQETMMIEYDGAFGSSNSHLALIISASLDILQCVFGS